MITINIRIISIVSSCTFALAFTSAIAIATAIATAFALTIATTTTTRDYQSAATETPMCLQKSINMMFLLRNLVLEAPRNETARVIQKFKMKSLEFGQASQIGNLVLEAPGLEIAILMWKFETNSFEF